MVLFLEISTLPHFKSKDYNSRLALKSLILITDPFDLGSAGKKRKPNIQVIWDDDFGADNISTYNNEAMGCGNPNIDRIAKEDARFTVY
jgi:hypothetical protein